jgi:hypothetical protein
MERRKLKWTAIALGAAGMIIFGLALPSAELCAAEPQSFAEDILPIFKGRCVGCHQAGSEGYEKSGLDLTSYEGLMKGTKFGAMVVPRHAGRRSPRRDILTDRAWVSRAAEPA